MQNLRDANIRKRRSDERGAEMRGEGGAAFHFVRGAFSTAGWLALNRQYCLLTLARGVGRWLTEPDASSSRICLWAACDFMRILIRDLISGTTDISENRE